MLDQKLDLRKLAWKKITKDYGISIQSRALDYLVEHMDTKNVDRTIDFVIAKSVENKIRLINEGFIVNVLNTKTNLPNTNGFEGDSNADSLEILDIDRFPMIKWDDRDKTFKTEPRSEDNVFVWDISNDNATIESKFCEVLSIIQKTTSGKTKYVNSISSLIGEYKGAEISIVGVLSISKENRLVLEDRTSTIPIVVDDQTQIQGGVLTIGYFAVVKGCYEVTSVKANEVMTPPICEKSMLSSYFSTIDIWRRSLKIPTYNKSSMNLVILKDVWLDDPCVFENLKRLIVSSVKKYKGNVSFVLSGSFTGQEMSLFRNRKSYRKGFADLLKLLTVMKDDLVSSTFIFIPGRDDAIANSFPPYFGFPKQIKSNFMDIIGNCYFSSSILRMRLGGYFDVVFVNDNIINWFKTNSIFPLDGNIAEMSIETILGNLTLYSLDDNVQPVFRAFNSSISLLPFPDAMFIFDEHVYFDVVKNKIRFLNAGSFSKDQVFSLVTLGDNGVHISKEIVGGGE